MRIRIALAVIIISLPIFAQHPVREMNASEIELALNKLTVLGSALYMAAHPDDENTALLAYFSDQRLLRTGYLALTRGDGGQNLIGTEKGVQLGLIRTQELLAARRIDGAKQFFTRAVDFGYSKTPEETLQKWDKEKILADVVWVIRKFRPDIIITRFTPEVGGHGHHRASAILAEEAFSAAADPNRFPEQLKYVEAWQAKRLVWNGWSRYLEREKIDTENLVKVDLGAYNPLLGLSYEEIAAKSRTMHKSQGFGRSGYRGSRLNYFIHTLGDSAREDLLEDIELSWKRVPDGEAIGNLLKEAADRFNPENPAESLPLLLDAYQRMSYAPENYWIEVKRGELLEVIRACAGIWMEAIAGDYSATPGSDVQLTLRIVNRSDFNFRLFRMEKPLSAGDTLFNTSLKYNQPLEWKTSFTLPADVDYSQPYWLKKEPAGAIFQVSDQKMIGMAQNQPALIAGFELSAREQKIKLSTPVYYRWTDRVDGELYRNVEIVPQVVLKPQEEVYVFPDGKARPIQVKLQANREDVSGKLSLKLPQGWQSQPASIPFSLKDKYSESLFTFTITPPRLQSDQVMGAVASAGGKTFDQALLHIEYSHIPIQTLLLPAAAKIVRLNLKKNKEKIAYIMGSGDDIPKSLRQLGYDVTVISGEELNEINFPDFQVIITGIRAYNTNRQLVQAKSRLMDFVKSGGTLIDQYNTTWGLLVDHPGPYPMKLSHDRVSVEEAPVKFIDGGHVLLNYPNKITSADFEGWVQERGLYFASEWDSRYQPILSAHDPGEPAREGGMLYARFGKGHYIYSGYSWFRELPAGVPGAYRIFVNMISVGSANE